MKSQIYKRLVLVAMLISLVFVVTDVTAKKPPKDPPPDVGDTCSELTFSPDYVFYRVTGKRKNQKITIFLAESSTGCEKALVEFPRLVDGEYLDIRDLRFSSIVEQGVTFGRVIWRRYGGALDAVWGYDFSITGIAVEPIKEPRQILISSDSYHQRINELDLSPDTGTLAFKLYKKNPAADTHVYSIRMIDIGDCDASPAACLFDDDRAMVFAETSPSSEFDENLGDPAWGPLGRRIYFLYFENDYRVLQFVELEEGWENTTWPPSFDLKNLYSSELQPEFQKMRSLAGGIMDGVEYLAVELPHEKINCGYIYLLNVQDCERVDDPVCFTGVEFEGANPSWTKDGKVIHHYYDPKQRACSVYGGTVGIYDGTNLDILDEGFYPDAAGG
jgi:hypothetical protein